MARLELALMGSPEVRLDGVAVAGFRSVKAQALLYYLAVTGQAHMRPALADLLWGEWPESSARTNLNQTLYNLRQLVGDHLTVAWQTAAFDRESDYWLDVEDLQSPTAELTQVLNLLRGEFLEGFHVNEAPAFEAWLLRQRVLIRQQVLETLDRLAQAHGERGDWTEAIEATRHLLVLESWREEGHRRLMRLLAQSGQRSAALAQYETCRRLLAEELGVEPSAEMAALYAQIRAGNYEGVRIAQDQERTSTLPYAPAHPRPPSLMTNLPMQATPFVGRADELSRILRRLSDPACRLLTLVGPGGIGKTRLTIETAQRLLDGKQDADLFAHGIFFVPLVAVETGIGIVTAIADAVGLRFYGSTPPQQQLLGYLQEKQMLLVLDNFEHLLAETALLPQILGAAAGVKLLVTSRMALNLQEEWFHRVAGMHIPPLDSGTALDSYDAVQLFMQNALRARLGFALDNEARHVVHICRLVEGMPLALELAAAWLKVLPAMQIAAEIERNLDILTARQQNVPDRHRSMWVVLEQTWQMLSANEQAVLAQLSVFVEGFEQEAAEAVAGATLLMVAMLVEKSLLRPAPDGRYQMHELLRQFAARQLAQDRTSAEAAQARHAAYYARFLQTHTAGLKGERYQETYAAITGTFANIRAAWQHAVAQKEIGALDCMAEALFIMGDDQGSDPEIEAMFRRSVAALMDDQSEPEHNAMVGFLLVCQGYLVHRRGGWQEGRTLLEGGIARIRSTRGSWQQKEAFALLYQGWLHSSQTDNETAVNYGQQSLALFAEAGDRWGMAACSEMLGAATKRLGQPLEAKRQLQEALRLSTEIKASRLRYSIIQNLSDVLIWLGQYALAQQYVEATYRVTQQPGLLSIVDSNLRILSKLQVCQGRYTEALATAEKSMLTAREMASPWELFRLETIGTAYRLLGRTAEAERAYEAFLLAAQARGHQPAIADCRRGLSALALDQGEYGRAEELLQQALAWWQQSGFAPGIAGGLAQRGHIGLALGEAGEAEARRCYAEALALATDHGLAPVALDVLAGVAVLLARAGDSQRAFHLAALAAGHPASTQEIRQKARKLLARRPTALSFPEAAPTAESPATGWKKTATEVLAVLRRTARTIDSN